MFVNDKVIYLQLQKTGCTHISRLLAEFLGGSTTAKHGRIDGDPGNRIVIGSVRNPWDWYVSLWAYGCMGEGSIKRRLTESRATLARKTIRGSVAHPETWLRLPGRVWQQQRAHDSMFWRRVYADASDRLAFREWLQAIHEPSMQEIVFEDPRPLALHRSVGLYTARLMFLFSDPAAWRTQAPGLSTLSDAKTFFKDHAVVERIIRTESIGNDLAKLMADMGRSDIDEAKIIAKGRTNSSQRKRFEWYYDQDSIDLVACRDSFVLGEFDYEKPDVD